MNLNAPFLSHSLSPCLLSPKIVVFDTPVAHKYLYYRCIWKFGCHKSRLLELFAGGLCLVLSTAGAGQPVATS